MTTFYHSRKNEISRFWNIDADDTTFLITDVKIANAFKEIEVYSNLNNIYSFSLDMWHSWTKGAHWSFGITYINNSINWFEIFDKYKKDWLPKLFSKYHPSLYNIDWFFTYLAEFIELPIKTFYIENCKFIHWDDFVCRKNYSCLCHWKNNKLYYPVLYDLFDDLTGCIPIASDCIKFDFNFNEKEANEFYRRLIPVNKVNI